MCSVLASRTVAALAAYVPFGDLLSVDVVVDRMAAVAGGAGGPFHVVRGIERLPPIGSRRDKVLPPDVVSNVPLCRLGKIIVADFGEVALLPDAAVNQSNLRLSKLAEGIRRQARNDGVGMLSRITDDVRHGCLFPVLVNLLVAFRASLRANVVRSIENAGLLVLLFKTRAAQVADV